MVLGPFSPRTMASPSVCAPSFGQPKDAQDQLALAEAVLAGGQRRLGAAVDDDRLDAGVGEGLGGNGQGLLARVPGQPVEVVDPDGDGERGGQHRHAPTVGAGTACLNATEVTRR